MPKLNKSTAKKTEEAASAGFDPVEPGPYEVRLRSVDGSKEGAAGPYWVWEFEIPEGHERAGKRFWVNTSLSEKALWKLNEVFTAFGVPTDTDTDELVGQSVLAEVSQRVIPSGQRVGELDNQVDKLLPLMSDGESEDEPF